MVRIALGDKFPSIKYGWGEINAYHKRFGNIVKINQENKQKILYYPQPYEQNQIDFILSISVVE